MKTIKITEDGRLDTRGLTDDETADTWRAYVLPALRALVSSLENQSGWPQEFPADHLAGHAILIVTPTIDQDGDRACLKLNFDAESFLHYPLFECAADEAAATKAERMKAAQ